MTDSYLDDNDNLVMSDQEDFVVSDNRNGGNSNEIPFDHNFN
jgi:hypothetical protein